MDRSSRAPSATDPESTGTRPASPRPPTNNQHPGKSRKHRKKPAKNGGAKAISQVELQSYRESAEVAKKMAADAELKRGILMKRLDAGARIAPGKLTASIITQEFVYFTAEAVALILNPEVVTAIRTLIPPTATRRLNVHEVKK